MFGYITVYKPDLKFREFDTYQSYYCGLCQCLKKRYGFIGQLTLSYDITFAALLLSSLYEPKTSSKYCRCIAHPLEKHLMVSNEVLEYLADMNVLLTIYKCEDDWNDEKKLIKKAFGNILNQKSAKRREEYCHKEDFIRDRLKKMSEAEAEGCKDIFKISGLFGEIMSEILAYKEDEWAESLRQIGYHLGRFIYVLDAYDDLEKDIRKKNYNPFIQQMSDETFNDDVQMMLTMIISDCCREFEILPLLENIEILRNILYNGVWGKFEVVRDKRTKGSKK